MDGGIYLVLAVAAAAANVVLALAPEVGKARRAADQPRPYVDLRRAYAEWCARMAKHSRTIRPEKDSAVVSSAVETERYG
jgi:hypothetical protein